MSVPCIDPLDVAGDEAMPTLALALDPDLVGARFAGLPRLTGPRGRVRVLAAGVLRYKPGRRCVIEYRAEVQRSDGSREAVRLIGKIRRRRSGVSAFKLQASLWASGFSDDSADGISVPEPLGVLPEVGMWLQRAAPGRAATELLAARGGPELAGRIAEAAHKLHRAGVRPLRRHSMADEVRILRERLAAVTAIAPRWAGRIARVLCWCERLAASVPEPVARGIHRDYYADQVLVHGAHLYLTDFDCYCQGDPALDIGNFTGHVREHALRALGDPEALAPVERALEDRFAELAGEAVRPAVRAYATLTLARHIHLSTVLADRTHLTGQLLELCEEALGSATRARSRCSG
ncbi:MAG: aminoglycoside phosphotransferase family protein [Candidatus Rokubacteria bacterium]|nr:aminoglycoside phosphotransferase family protein [Candidatus Rokubacteria bacterium]